MACDVWMGATPTVSAVWQVEQDINPDNCSGSCGGFANRNSFVGLKGSWGRAIAGRYDMYWTSHIAGMDSRIINAGLAGFGLRRRVTGAGEQAAQPGPPRQSLPQGSRINTV